MIWYPEEAENITIHISHNPYILDMSYDKRLDIDYDITTPITFGLKNKHNDNIKNSNIIYEKCLSGLLFNFLYVDDSDDEFWQDFILLETYNYGLNDNTDNLWAIEYTPIHNIILRVKPSTCAPFCRHAAYKLIMYTDETRNNYIISDTWLAIAERTPITDSLTFSLPLKLVDD